MQERDWQRELVFKKKRKVKLFRNWTVTLQGNFFSSTHLKNILIIFYFNTGIELK